MGAFWNSITGDSQMRWIGPEKGVVHLATAAVVNAVWDLYAKLEGKPLWKLLVDMMDANQVWDVPQAVEWIEELARFRPLWIEEPTSPDDVLGHAAIARAVAPIGVATGEQCHNRVMFKQLFQAGAISFCQIDSCRLGGVNEVIAVLLIITCTSTSSTRW